MTMSDTHATGRRGLLNWLKQQGMSRSAEGAVRVHAAAESTRIAADGHDLAYVPIDERGTNDPNPRTGSAPPA